MSATRDEIDGLANAAMVKAIEVAVLSGVARIMDQAPAEYSSLENLADGVVAAIAKARELDPRIEGMILARLLERAGYVMSTAG